MRQIILIGVGLAMLVVAGCSYRPYGYDAQDRGAPPPPPRPTFGHTYGGRGTWQDLGGGMTAVRDTETGQTTILMGQ
jgi:hypothetical protein